jgi:plastocyanin
VAGYTGSTGAGYTGSAGSAGGVGYTGSQGTAGYIGSAGGAEFVFQNSGFNYSVDGFSDSTYPDLTLVRGQTYYFNLTNVTSSHPLALRLSSGNTSAIPGTSGNNASSGAYGNGTTLTMVTYRVPFDAPATIVYQCVVHAGMIGTINIVDQTGYTGSAGTAGSTGAIGYTGSASTVAGYTGSAGAGYTGSAGSAGPAGGTELVFQNSGFNYSVDGFSDSTYPTLTVVKGELYYFNLTNITSSHPLALRLSSGSTSAVPGTTGNNPSSGVYGNGTTPTTVIYRVPFDAPATLYYQCVYHSGMIGSINTVDQTGYTGSSGTAGGTGYTGSAGIDGYTGSVGYTGSKGDWGNAGPVGYTGSEGTFSGSTASLIITSNTASTSTATGALQVAGGAGIAGNLNVGGTVYFTGDILPTSNNTVNIGSATNRFGTLFLAANTIDLGGTTITTAPNGELIFTTQAGNVSLSANTINFLSTVANTSNNSGDMNVTGNLTVNKIYANSYFYANGTALTSGTATSNGSSVYGNFDGGFPDSVHGGIPSIDAGSIV